MKENATIRDYINEAEVFPYSKEYFDMVKEASEINLMTLAVEAADFLEENTELLTEQVDMISSIFIEATGDAEAEKEPSKAKEDVKAGSGAVKEKLWKRVWEAILRGFRYILTKVFTPIGAFLSKLIEKIPGLDKAEISVPASLKDIVKVFKTLTKTLTTLNKSFEDTTEKRANEGAFKKGVRDVKEKIREKFDMKSGGIFDFGPARIKELEKLIEQAEGWKTLKPITVRGYQLKSWQKEISSLEIEFKKEFLEFEKYIKGDSGQKGIIDLIGDQGVAHPTVPNYANLVVFLNKYLQKLTEFQKILPEIVKDATASLNEAIKNRKEKKEEKKEDKKEEKKEESEE